MVLDLDKLDTELLYPIKTGAVLDMSRDTIPDALRTSKSSWRQRLWAFQGQVASEGGQCSEL